MPYSIKEHGTGNRDFNRYFSAVIPGTGYGLLNMAYVSQLSKMSNNSALLNEMIDQQVRKTKGLKALHFKLPKAEAFKDMPKAFKDILKLSMNRYDPRTNTVFHSGKAGLAAHEFGHAQQFANPKYAKYAYPITKLSRVAGALGAFAPIFTDDEKEARRNSMIASGLQLPMLAEEFDASRRGSKIMKTTSGLVKHAGKASKLKNLLMLASPYAGLPTYILQAALPWLIYKYMKKRGKYGGEYESMDNPYK
mgnify:FL=1